MNVCIVSIIESHVCTIAKKKSKRVREKIKMNRVGAFFQRCTKIDCLYSFSNPSLVRSSSSFRLLLLLDFSRVFFFGFFAQSKAQKNSENQTLFSLLLIFSMCNKPTTHNLYAHFHFQFLFSLYIYLSFTVSFHLLWLFGDDS
jgi:hypothetical protein